MRNTLFIIFIFFVCRFSFLSAQNSESLFTGGTEFSLIASQIDGDYNVGYHKLSPAFGIYTDLWLKKNLSLRSGIYYMPKGARSGVKYTFFVTRFYYAEIPIIATYYFNNKFSASLGICFDYLFYGYYFDGVMKTDYKDLNVTTMDYAHYWSFNVKISEKLSVRFIQNYSLLPITRPITSSCWVDNMFFYWMFRTVPPQACWWNNVLKLAVELKLY